MGNARGNKNSRHHVSLNPDDNKEKQEFFNFSWEEIALYDLSAMIDYTLASTNKEKLHYIGHSQGGTAFLVLISMKPEYNKRIHSAHLWAGVGYQNHFPNSELSQAARFTDTIYVSTIYSYEKSILCIQTRGGSVLKCLSHHIIQMLSYFRILISNNADRESLPFLYCLDQSSFLFIPFWHL